MFMPTMPVFWPLERPFGLQLERDAMGAALSEWRVIRPMSRLNSGFGSRARWREMPRKAKGWGAKLLIRGWHTLS